MNVFEKKIGVPISENGSPFTKVYKILPLNTPFTPLKPTKTHLDPSFYLTYLKKSAGESKKISYKEREVIKQRKTRRIKQWKKQ
jgi:hypothetical protein